MNISAMCPERRGHLDILYSPSKWTMRGCEHQVLREHLEYIRAESANAREMIPCQVDVAYGHTAAEQLDIFGTDLPDDSPICLYLHGGAWKTLDRKDSAFPAVTLHALGVKTFVADYALCPEVTLQTITEQVRRVFDYTCEYAARSSAKCVYLMGHSAGAHLVAYLLSTTRRSAAAPSVTHAILVSGLYDMRPLVRCYANAWLRLGEEESAQLSPLVRLQAEEGRRNWTSWGPMSVALVVAENDSPALHGNSEQLHALLKGLESEQSVRYFEIPRCDHFTILEMTSDACDDAQSLKDVLCEVFQ